MISASILAPKESVRADFALRIINWQKVHGRHDLPWQNTRDPYAIWVSEIMLQQTQVSAVVGYYQRFMQRFPDIVALANASQEDVLQYWSGLGYYSRARNLHAAAQQIIHEHSGQFPKAIEAILALPGIGRSTAAAIAAFAFGQHQAILDGNVKRVLARCFGIEGWPGNPLVEKEMWLLVEGLIPEQGIEAYTQGLMDLGATLCTRKPACNRCPLQDVCKAYLENTVHLLPSPKPRRAVPQRETVMLMILYGNEILLQRRPQTGIWGGLWSLPEVAATENTCEVARQRFGLETEALPTLPPMMHTFTHFTLKIIPQPMQIKSKSPQLLEPAWLWLDIEDAADAALPAPVKKLFRQLAQLKMQVAA